MRVNSINDSCNSSTSPSIRGSGNKGIIMEKQGMVKGGEDSVQPTIGRLYGDNSSNKDAKDVLAEPNEGFFNKEINSKKGKNVYVGQWDTIKEKMVWDSLDKINDARIIKEISSCATLAGTATKGVTPRQIEGNDGLFLFGSKSLGPCGRVNESQAVNTRSGKNVGKS